MIRFLCQAYLVGKRLKVAPSCQISFGHSVYGGFILKILLVILFFLSFNSVGATFAGSGAHEWGRAPKERCLFCHVGTDRMPDGSASCLICHDGSLGSHAITGVFGASELASHPIGMAYPKGQRYRLAEDAVLQGVHFQEGTVVCTSCHNPHSEETLMLRIKKGGSSLCFACHDI